MVRLCSLTKIFTTDLLTKLVADGAVRLDDPLQRFAAPTRTLVPKRIMPITLADLATHTSGLPRELGSAPRGTPHFTYPTTTPAGVGFPASNSAAPQARRLSTPMWATIF